MLQHRPGSGTISAFLGSLLKAGGFDALMLACDLNVDACRATKATADANKVHNSAGEEFSPPTTTVCRMMRVVR